MYANMRQDSLQQNTITDLGLGINKLDLDGLLAGLTGSHLNNTGTQGHLQQPGPHVTVVA
jgi:hypothetical protein